MNSLRKDVICVVNTINIKKEMLSLRIPSETNKKLGNIAKAKGLSKNAFILTLINKVVESN